MKRVLPKHRKKIVFINPYPIYAKGVKKATLHPPHGGPYATVESDFLLKHTQGNIVVRGKGEHTIVDCINNINTLSEVKSLSYRNGSKIIMNQERELIEDLDSIPFPAYHLLPNFPMVKKIGKFLNDVDYRYGKTTCTFPLHLI